MGDSDMRVRWVFVCLFIFFVSIHNVEAQVCDKEDIARVEAFASTLTPVYTHIGISSDWQLYSVQFNLGEYADELSFSEHGRQDAKRSSDSIAVQSGHKSIDIFYDRCAERKVATIEVDLPFFNKYSTRVECNEVDNSIDVCNPNYEGKITESSFLAAVSKRQEQIEKENKSFDFVEIIKKYYFYFIGLCILLIGIVIYLVIQHNKHYKLD